MPTGVQHSVETVTAKGEDRAAVLLGGDASACSCFAVFDGHGGVKAAEHGVNKLAPALKAMGCNAKDGAISDAFWTVDADLGGTTTDGSTATVLLVSDASDGGLDCTLAWVGDSQGCLVDLGTGTVVAETTRHVAESEDEANRLNNTWQMARFMRLKAADHEKEIEDYVTPETVRSATQELEMSLSDTEVDIMARALLRGASIDAYKFGSSIIDSANVATSVLAPRVPGGKAFLHKVSTPGPSKTNTPDPSVHSGSQMGSILAQAEADGSKSFLAKAVTSQQLQTVSTAVTRAIDDWDGSRALVPHPEIRRHHVGRDGCYRAVLASDGLWDFLTVEAARKVLCSATDVAAAAAKLADTAKSKSNGKFNFIKDDITVVVVELNPSGAPPPLTLAEASGCCAVS